MMKLKGIKLKSYPRCYPCINFQTILCYRAIQAGYRKEIYLNGEWVRVIPAASWNQPDSIENQTRKSNLNKVKDEDKSIYNILVIDESKETIHVLNNDCLMHIFMYLPIADRVRIERGTEIKFIL